MMRSLLVIVLAAGVAHAGKADQLFKKGKKLLAQKNYAEACAAFEESDKLDPGIGAKLNVAKCYQEWGRLATALKWYRDAEQMAAQTKDDRTKKIHALAEELDGNVPRLTIRVPIGASAADLKIKLDGARFDDLGSEQRVDPGPHKIDYVVDGTPKSKVVPVERGGSSEVTLEIPKTAKVDKPKDPPKEPKEPKEPKQPKEPKEPVAQTPEPEHPGRLRKIAGLSVAGAGVVTMGVAGLLTLGAKSDYDAALKAHCMGAKDMCDTDGLRLTKDARSTANTMTVVTIIGAAAVAGGLVLFFTAPSAPASNEHAMYLAPTADRTGAGIVFGGSF